MRRLLLLVILFAGWVSAVAVPLSVGSRQELLRAFADAEAAAVDDTVTILIASGVYWLPRAAHRQHRRLCHNVQVPDSRLEITP